MTPEPLGLDEALNPSYLTEIPAPPPDLTIPLYTTDIPGLTTLCDTSANPPDTLPNVHCNGGVRAFVSTVVIKNIGVGALPGPDTLELQWLDFNFGSFPIVKVPHNGINPGDSIFASRPYYVGPCDCVDQPGNNPWECFAHAYAAVVDPLNKIFESNEMNNASELYWVCDGCGDCADVEPVPIEAVLGL